MLRFFAVFCRIERICSVFSSLFGGNHPLLTNGFGRLNWVDMLRFFHLTGAGMGMKSPRRRNFEAGILTDEPSIVAATIEEFDKVWRGSECAQCQRRNVCPDPII